MNIRQFLSVVEIKTKIVSVSTFSIALLYVLLAGWQPSLLTVILLFAAVLMVDMGTTAFNSFFDYVKGVDQQSLNREREKVLVHEKVAPGLALIVALSLFAAAAVLGLYFAILRGWPVLLLGAASLAVGLLYSGGPRPISHSPLGELFAGGFLGSVLFLVIAFILAPADIGNAGSSWAVFPWGSWLLYSLPSLLLIASILTVNNTCDLEADRQAGRQTLSILIGRRASEYLIFLLVTVSFVSLLLLAVSGAGGLHPLGAAIPALILPLALHRLGAMCRGGMVQSRKGPSMVGISGIFIWFTLAALCAQGLSLLIR
jgi:1,4-dihydroxy-2-naphthoate octaprenyltransferase